MHSERFQTGSISTQDQLSVVRCLDDRRTRAEQDLHTKSTADLITWYRSTAQYERSVQGIIAQDWPSVNRQVDDLYQYLAGSVFEDLAYATLQSKLVSRKDLVVLSPEQTFAFFRAKYRGTTVTGNLGQQSIDGVSVPDGLILATTSQGLQVQTICEYTVSTKYNYLQKDDERKAPARALFRSDMDVMRGASVLYVLPQNSVLGNTFKNRHDEPEKLPISTYQHRHLLNSMYMDAASDMALPRVFGDSF